MTQNLINLIKKEQDYIQEKLDNKICEFKKYNHINEKFYLEKYGCNYLKLVYIYSFTQTDLVHLMDTLIENKDMIENDTFSLMLLNSISTYIAEYNKLQEILVLNSL